MLKENLTIVRRMDYAPQPIFLNIESSLEYNVRLKSCAKEPETVRWIEEFVKEGDTFFDVGANVGAYSLVAAKTTEGKAKIYAFEPAFPNFAQLCHNIYLNGCGDCVVPLPIALSDKTVLDNLNYNNLMPGGALHAVGDPVDFKGRQFRPVFQQGVLSFRLDDVVSQFALDPPNHVKIDVDGIELSILKGAPETLSGTSLRSAVSHLSSGTPFPPGSLVVSFDDGYKSNLSNAYPVLEQYSVPFTVFVTTDYMSGKSIPWWDSVNQAIADTTATVTLDLDSLQGSFELESRSEKRRLYAHVRRLMLTYPQWEREITSHLKERVPGWRGETEQDAFLSKEDLRRMAQNSLVEIGSHSRSHASLPRLEEEALLREVRDSRSTLEEELGRPVESFAYPYGEPADVSALVARVVQDCGYRCALTGVPGTVNLGDDAFQLRRVSVDGRDDWPKFTGKLAGVSQFLRSAGKAVFRGNDR